MRAPPRRLFLGTQLVLAALVLFFVGRALVEQWQTFRSVPLEAQPRWTDIVLSAALVLVTYALLVQTWRVMLHSWNADLPFWKAVRIWSVSNLGRYVPGKVWQITAMGVMTTREGVSAMVATGSALLNTIVNVACGIAIVLALGWNWMDRIGGEARIVAVLLLVLAAAGLLSLPFTIPRMSALVARVTGRQIALESPPPRFVVASIVGNVVAWVLYGLAFMWLVRGVLGDAAGAPWQYIAVYTASYVVGYLFLFLPGGIGPREGVMVALLTALGMATNKQAWLVAGASRAWLTVLEIAPGLVFMALDAGRRGSSTKLPADVSNK